MMALSKVELVNRIADEVDRAEARGDTVSQDWWQGVLESAVAELTVDDFESEYR